MLRHFTFGLLASLNDVQSILMDLTYEVMLNIVPPQMKIQMNFIWRISPDGYAIAGRIAVGCHCAAAADQNDDAAVVWH